MSVLLNLFKILVFYLTLLGLDHRSLFYGHFYQSWRHTNLFLMELSASVSSKNVSSVEISLVWDAWSSLDPAATLHCQKHRDTDKIYKVDTEWYIINYTDLCLLVWAWCYRSLPVFYLPALFCVRWSSVRCTELWKYCCTVSWVNWANESVHPP